MSCRIPHMKACWFEVSLQAADAAAAPAAAAVVAAALASAATSEENREETPLTESPGCCSNRGSLLPTAVVDTGHWSAGRPC